MSREIREEDLISFYFQGGFQAAGRVISVDEYVYAVQVGNLGTYFVPKSERVEKTVSSGGGVVARDSQRQ